MFRLEIEIQITVEYSEKSKVETLRNHQIIDELHHKLQKIDVESRRFAQESKKFQTERDQIQRSLNVVQAYKETNKNDFQRIKQQLDDTIESNRFVLVYLSQFIRF